MGHIERAMKAIGLPPNILETGRCRGDHALCNEHVSKERMQPYAPNPYDGPSGYPRRRGGYEGGSVPASELEAPSPGLQGQPVIRVEVKAVCKSVISERGRMRDLLLDIARTDLGYAGDKATMLLQDLGYLGQEANR